MKTIQPLGVVDFTSKVCKAHLSVEGSVAGGPEAIITLFAIYNFV